MMVRALVFNALFFGLTALGVVICIPLLAFPPRASQLTVRVWAEVMLWLLKVVVGLRYRIVGTVPAGGVVLAAKHQSAWETIIFLAILDKPAYVLKRELLRIPVWGWFAQHCGHIPVDRGGGASALKGVVDAARPILASGGTVAIFPQGTRVAPGATAPYQPGVYAMASQLGVPVVPVALNSGLFWGRKAFLKRPGVVTLEFLEPIAPNLPRRQFMADLETRLEAASAALESAGQADLSAKA